MKTLYIKSVSLTALALLTSLNSMAADTVDDGHSWRGHVSGYIGQKTLDNGDWNQLDNQMSLGIIADFKKDNWPVSIAIDSTVSGHVYENGSIKNTGNSLTHYLGVRKVFALKNSNFQPYVGSEITFVDASLEF